MTDAEGAANQTQYRPANVPSHKNGKKYPTRNNNQQKFDNRYHGLIDLGIDIVFPDAHAHRAAWPFQDWTVAS